MLLVEESDAPNWRSSDSSALLGLYSFESLRVFCLVALVRLEVLTLVFCVKISAIQLAAAEKGVGGFWTSKGQ